jgi:archaemetzincin
MKTLSLVFISLIVFAGNCNRNLNLSLNNTKKKQIIALQPFGNFNQEEIDSVAKGISNFYTKEVFVFKPIDIPLNFYNKSINQYSADSLTIFLSKLRNDTVVEVVGLTHEPLFTIKKDSRMSYFDEKIFGMGYQPGNSCVVSDYKFRTDKRILFVSRLRNVIKHEIGHNLGLGHCKNDKCIMSEMNGDLKILDDSGDTYCEKCRKTLIH